MKDDALRFALQNAVKQLVSDEVTENREGVMEALVELHEDTGAKQIAVKLPGGEQVATLTIMQPSPRNVVDEGRLLAWCRENRPDLVETIHHEATEAWDEEKVNAEAFRKIDAETVDGDWITSDGEQIDGIKTVVDPPKSFTVKYTGGKDGRTRLIDAWRSGELSAIEPGGTLPQIGA